jgi:hypothetical protein
MDLQVYTFFNTGLVPPQTVRYFLTDALEAHSTVHRLIYKIIADHLARTCPEQVSAHY